MRTALFLPLLFVPALASAQAPILDVAPGRLTFIVASGSGASAVQNLRIRNIGAGTLAWRAVPSAPWLRVAPPSGQAPGTVAVDIDATRLSPGSHAGRITVSAIDGPDVVPVVIDVGVQVAAGAARQPERPVAAAPPAGVPPAVTQGGGAVSSGPSPDGRSGSPRLDLTAPEGAVEALESPVTIGSPPEGPTEWFARSDKTWLTVEPSTGMTPLRVTVRADPSGLPPGVHWAVLQFVDDAREAMLVVPISLTIGNPAAESAAADPATGNPPTTRPVDAKPEAEGAGEARKDQAPQPLSVAIESLAPILRNLPYSQTIPVEGGTPPYAVGIAEGRLPAGIVLANGALRGVTRFPGTYLLNVVVTDSSTPPQTAAKVLTLRVIIAYQDLALTISQASVSLVARAGRRTREFGIGVASGSQSLDWSAAADKPWIRIAPARGVTPGGFQVAADAAGLAPGVYAGTVTITMEGAPNSPMRIPVQLSVSR